MYCHPQRWRNVFTFSQVKRARKKYRNIFSQQPSLKAHSPSTKGLHIITRQERMCWRGEEPTFARRRWNVIYIWGEKKKKEEKWLNNNISSVHWNMLTKLVPYRYWPFQWSFSKKCVTSNALACKISLLLGWHEAYITDYQLDIAAPGTETNKLAKTDETASMLVLILDKPVQNRVRVRVNLFCTNLHGTYSSRISMLGTVPDIQSMYALQNHQQY